MGIFHREGYRTMEDVENLKELTVDQLQAMGIHKTGEGWSLGIILCKMALWYGCG